MPDSSRSPAEIAASITHARFTPVRLREGYDMGEVDDFLDRLVEAVQHGRPVRPLVDAAVFTPVRLREGYDMGQVDVFLEQVCDEVDGPTSVASPPPTTAAAEPVRPDVIQERRGLFGWLRGGGDR